MYLLILFFPLLGTLFSGFGGRWLGSYGTSILSTICITLSFLISCIVFYEVIFGGLTIYLELCSWISSGIFEVKWGLLFDSVTVIMLIVITSISSLVHLYSIGYMENDPHLPRFMSYLEIFTFFMLILVTSDNFIQMFLGWEGVGLASYLLINFWFTRLAANQSALKALIVNRIGDFGLLLAILIIFFTFNSTDYLIIFSLVPLIEDQQIFMFNFYYHTITIIGIFLFIGAIGKSAQLGLHTWLPDAMEGPTPVSALIHAATMVTAGIFLVIRCSPLLEFSKIILTILIIFGSLTAFFASMTGLFQNDLKRVIAYSTCSQLGYMMFASGISCYNVSMFHLTNHAFFKALLFLSAGSIIHAVSDEQDMRRMGALVKFLPVTYVLMTLGSLALIGIPFLTGFYSKDFILEISQVFRNQNLNLHLSEITCWLGGLSVCFTTFYSFRLIFLIFINNTNINRVKVSKIQESSLIMLIPLVILGLGSLFVGYFFKDLFIGLGTDMWKTSIFFIASNIYFLEAEYLEISIKWIPFFFSLITFLIVFLLQTNIYNLYNYNVIRSIYFFLNKKWFFDFLYNKILVYPILNFGYNISFKNLDRGFIELIGPFGVSYIINKLSQKTIILQTGFITHYLFFIIVGICFNLYNYECFDFKNQLINLYLVLIFFI